MTLNIQAEIARVKKFYETDERQQGFNLLLLSEVGAGKSFLLRTARKPVWIDSFDPGGTKGLKKWIESGEIIADTQYETEDPFNPKVYKLWRSNFKKRYASGLFDQLGTYCIDSSTTFSSALMGCNMGEAGRAGETPMHRRDYNSTKIEMQNYFRKCLNFSCDFILTGHLKAVEKKIGVRKDGDPIVETKWRFMTIGQASVFIPLLFDEIYIMLTKEGPGRTVRRELLLDSTGEYLARSRLKADGVLDTYEEPDLKAILRKAKYDYRDKPLFNFETKGGEKDEDRSSTITG